MTEIITTDLKQLDSREQVLLLAKNDLISFGRLFLPMDFNRSATPEFHRELANAYMSLDAHPQLAVFLPRGHAKSVYLKAYILWKVLFHDTSQMPLFIGWAADTKEKAFNNIEYIRDNIENNSRILYYFGEQRGDYYGNKWNEKYRQLKNGCTIVSRSNAVSLRGETKGGVMGTRRYTDVALDDIENEDNTKTYASRESLKNTIVNAVFNATDMWEGHLIYNQTPVHPDSLCQNLIDNYRRSIKEGRDFSWHVILHGATQPTMEGGVLWHSYCPRKKLDEIKQFYIDTKGTAEGYYQEYELQVMNQEAKIWTRDSYELHTASYYWDDNLNHSFLDWAGNRFPVKVYIGCDPATDIDTFESDYSAVVVIAVDEIGRIFVLDIITSRCAPQQSVFDAHGNLLGEKGVVNHLIDAYDMYHADGAVLEDVGMTRGMWQDLDSYFEKHGSKGRTIIPIQPLGANKLEKIKSGIGRFFSYHLVYLREDHWDLREQIEGFSKKMPHDDVIEAFYFATTYMEKPVLRKDRNKYVEDDERELRSWVVA